MTSTPSLLAIGDRPLSLAAHLRRAVDLLLDRAHARYDWYNPGQCNCSILAQCITGLSSSSLVDAIEIATDAAGVNDATWKVATSPICAFTGAKLSDIVRALLQAGLLIEDLHHLEQLNHPELAKTSWKGKRQNKRPPRVFRRNAAYYMQRWALAIEAFHADRAAENEHGASVGHALTNVLEPLSREDTLVHG